jgi:MurNAc alpha-1-phosphate uridylyltransferase
MLPIAILAGGYGTRLGELGRDIPKSLVKIGGIPFIDLQLDLLEKSGYTDVVICVSQKAELLIEYLSKKPRGGLKVDYSFDGTKQLGTGGSLKNALPMLGSKFAVIYGDSYLPIDFSLVENQFVKNEMNGLITIYKNENMIVPSNIEISGRYVSRYSKLDRNEMEYVDYGLSYWDARVFRNEAFPESFDLNEIYQDLISRGELQYFEVSERFYEVGSLKGIEELANLVGGNNE